MPGSFPIITGDMVSAATLNSLVGLDRDDVPSGTKAFLELTVPAGITPVRIVGSFRTNQAVVRSGLRMSVNNHSETDVYRGMRITWPGSASPAFNFDTSNAHWELGAIPGANAGGARTGTLVLTLVGPPAGMRPRIFGHSAVIPTTTSTDSRITHVTGDVGGGAAQPVVTIRLFPDGGQFVPGTEAILFRG